MNNFELCRNNLHKRLGIESQKKRDPIKMSAEIHRQTKKLDEIISFARPRLIMGGIRYGSDWNHDSLMKYMQKKFDIYKETGNYEMLIDFVNFVAIEGTLKTHSNFHLNPVDRNDD